MKTFTAMATLTLLTLSACSSEEELKAAQAQVDALQKENTTLKSKAAELEGRFATTNAERDELKSQLERAAAAATALARPNLEAAPPSKLAAKKPARRSRKK